MILPLILFPKSSTVRILHWEEFWTSDRSRCLRHIQSTFGTQSTKLNTQTCQLTKLSIDNFVDWQSLLKQTSLITSTKNTGTSTSSRKTLSNVAAAICQRLCVKLAAICQWVVFRIESNVGISKLRKFMIFQTINNFENVKVEYSSTSECGLSTSTVLLNTFRFRK